MLIYRIISMQCGLLINANNGKLHVHQSHMNWCLQQSLNVLPVPNQQCQNTQGTQFDGNRRFKPQNTQGTQFDGNRRCKPQTSKHSKEHSLMVTEDANLKPQNTQRTQFDGNRRCKPQTHQTQLTRQQCLVSLVARRSA